MLAKVSQRLDVNASEGILLLVCLGLSFEVERRACFLLWCVSDGTQIVVDPFLVSFSSLFRLQEQVHQFCHRGSEGHYSDFVWRLVLRWTVWSNDKAMGRMVETASQSICSIELTLIWMRMTQWHCLDVTWPNYHDFVTSTQHLATWLYFQWSQLSTSGANSHFASFTAHGHACHCARPWSAPWHCILRFSISYQGV